MFDYKMIPTTEIAEKLGLKKSRNGKWRCFNKAAHNNGDKNASLSISEQENKGFHCFGCGIEGNNVELVKLFFKIDEKKAIQWIVKQFEPGHESHKASNGKSSAGKNKAAPKTTDYQLRFIKKQIAEDNRFMCYGKDRLDLRDPSPEDIENIRRELGKSYSPETLNKAGVRINRSKAGYAMVFPKGQLTYNPHNCSQYLHVEGRTYWLTAIEIGLDKDFAIVSDFNKTSHIKIEGGSHYFIMDGDVDEAHLKENQIKIIRPGGVRFIRLPEGYKDLSDYYNNGEYSEEKLRALIDNTPLTELTPEKEEAGVEAAQSFNIYTAEYLMNAVFPEPRWAIPGLLPEGLTNLAGRPKSGKSWMALGWCIAVCSGGRAMGAFETRQGEALYIGLEDTPRRLKTRLKMILGAEYNPRIPEGFYFMNEFKKLEQGGEEQLRTLLKAKPELRIVVIDTYGRFISPRKNNQDLYSVDYAIGATLQKIALDYKIALVVIHHTRKVQSEYALDDVSGTTGVTAAADAVFVLKKNIYGAELNITGRDIEEQNLAIQFDKTTGLWKTLGNAAEVLISRERKTIIDAIKVSNKPLSPKEIADATGFRQNNVKQLTHKMKHDGLLETVDKGRYVVYDNPNNPGV
jgi:hypothetical protein